MRKSKQRGRRERRKKKRHCLLKGPRRQSTKTVTGTLVLEASAVRQEAEKYKLYPFGQEKKKSKC